MGRRGPAPKPTELRLLHGDRADRTNLDAPRPRELDPVAPPWLVGAALDEWQRVVPDLVVMGVARELDAMALAAYCEAVARLVAAARCVAELGAVVLDDDGIPHVNPAVRVVEVASNQVRAWGREFGMTPSARAGIRVTVYPGAGDASRLLTGAPAAR